jgi:hypothetical protein
MPSFRILDFPCDESNLPWVYARNMQIGTESVPSLAFHLDSVSQHQMPQPP